MRRNVAINNLTGLTPWIIDSLAPNSLPISYRHSFFETGASLHLFTWKKQRSIKCRCEHISNHVIPRRIALRWIVCLASVLNGVYACDCVRWVWQLNTKRCSMPLFTVHTRRIHVHCLHACRPCLGVHAEPLEVDARFGIWHLLDRKWSFRCVAGKICYGSAKMSATLKYRNTQDAQMYAVYADDSKRWSAEMATGMDGITQTKNEYNNHFNRSPLQQQWPYAFFHSAHPVCCR